MLSVINANLQITKNDTKKPQFQKHGRVRMFLLNPWWSEITLPDLTKAH